MRLIADRFVFGLLTASAMFAQQNQFQGSVSTGVASSTPLVLTLHDAIDRGLKASPAENLLCQTLQTLLKIGCDVGHDILVGYLLLFHQDQGFGAIFFRPEVSQAEGHKAAEKQGRHQPPASPQCHGPVILPAN